MIDHLPADSYYAEACANDEELAEQLVDAPRPKNAGRPRISEWTSERQALARVEDALLTLVRVTVAANSSRGKAPKIPPAPRPVTAIELVKSRQAKRDHQRVVDLVDEARRRVT